MYNTMLWFIFFCLASTSGAFGAMADFADHAHLQPSELASGTRVDGRWRKSPLEILDLHHSPQKTTLAYTGVDQKTNNPYISFYDPVKKCTVQTVIMDSKGASDKKLGGSFSENGDFFTVGNVQPLYKPQDFHVYKRSDDGKYTLQQTISHSPSAGAYLSLPHTRPDRFAYDKDNKTIICSGEAVNLGVNPIQAIKDSYSLFTYGGAQSTGTLQPVFKVREGSMEILDPQKSLPVSHCIKTGPHPACTESPNKQHIVYTDFKGQSYAMDRATMHSKLVNHRPEILDNTGAMSLQRYYFPESKNGLLTAGSVTESKEKSTHGCTYSSK